MISQDELKQRLHYNLETGVFTWLVDSRVRKAGDDAGFKHHTGYIVIAINGRQYQAHRLAWLYVTGESPTGLIDHKDQVRDNNKFSNLRNATRSQNSLNSGIRVSNKCGFKGVFFVSSNNKFRAQAMLDGVKKHLGYFATAEDAHQAYVAFSKNNHGKFLSTK
jgi:hypothetical protein